jgi:fibronectin-binding autotransporter adhesin
MKIRSNPFLLASLGVVTALANVTLAGDVIKANNTDALSATSSWTGLVVPTASDVAVWDSTVTAANSPLAGASLSWSGIRIANPAGLVTIGGATPTAATTLSIGSSGIDLSAATQSLVISSPTTALLGAAQTWNVASGRNLRLGANGTGSANANLDGTAGTVVTVTGGGVVDLNQGGSLGFADAAGFGGFNGKWVVNAATTLRGLRNGATAFGTNTATDAITLNGGTLATGGIAGATGNWTWNSPITLAASTSSTIDNQNPSGSGRSLKLMGAFTGSGALTFASTGVGTMSADTGFILTGANTNSGAVTINSGAFLRVGGVTTVNDTTLAAGTGGTLGDGTVTNNVVNNGTLTFSRSGSHTVPNAISGLGEVRVGGGFANDEAQVVTLSGANTYVGATTINAGTLNLSGSLTSPVSVNAGAKLAGSGSTDQLLTSC